jgi:poly(U)-specific endoribonuclease
MYLESQFLYILFVTVNFFCSQFSSLFTSKQKGQIAKIRFTLNGLDKPSNSLFIGTSPELELAIYTVCFELRPDQECRMAYGGKDFNIVTHTFRYRGTNYIGSAYPEI